MSHDAALRKLTADLADLLPDTDVGTVEHLAHNLLALREIDETAALLARS